MAVWSLVTCLTQYTWQVLRRRKGSLGTIQDTRRVCKLLRKQMPNVKSHWMVCLRRCTQPDCFSNMTDLMSWRFAATISRDLRSSQSPALAGNAQNSKPASPTVWPHEGEQHYRTDTTRGPRSNPTNYARTQTLHHHVLHNPLCSMGRKSSFFLCLFF